MKIFAYQRSNFISLLTQGWTPCYITFRLQSIIINKKSTTDEIFYSSNLRFSDVTRKNYGKMTLYKFGIYEENSNKLLIWIAHENKLMCEYLQLKLETDYLKYKIKIEKNRFI